MPEHAVVAEAVEELASGFAGSIVQPGDERYDEARAVWNGLFDLHPALVAQCASTADVQAAVDFARANDLTVAVRGGGHSAAGYGTCDGGLVIDLSPMKAIEVPRRTASRSRAGASPPPASPGSRLEAAAAGSSASAG